MRYEKCFDHSLGCSDWPNRDRLDVQFSPFQVFGVMVIRFRWDAKSFTLGLFHYSLTPSLLTHTHTHSPALCQDICCVFWLTPRICALEERDNRKSRITDILLLASSDGSRMHVRAQSRSAGDIIHWRNCGTAFAAPAEQREKRKGDKMWWSHLSFEHITCFH